MLNQQISQAIRDAVLPLLTGDAFRRYSGPSCEQLAGELAQRFTASEVLLCSSGTAALEIALRAAGVGEGDEVLLSAYDYPGNFWAIERVGARPLLIDVEPTGWRIEVERLEQAWQDSPAPALKAMVVSHLHGQLQNIPALLAWCQQRGLLLIEDACQAIGATLGGKAVGSLGHASIVSFGGGKVLSSGRGGALLTSDTTLAQRCRISAGAGSGPYGLSELQSTVVLAQLPWLNAITERSRQFFSELAYELQSHPLVGCPYADQLQQTSFYQGGLLHKISQNDQNDIAQLNAWQNAAVEALKSIGLPAGGGFDGFHRRSQRRCRTWQTLENTPRVAAGTITIHYSAALDPLASGPSAVKRIRPLLPS